MPTVAYNPGGGTAINVVETGDPDRMLYFGNLGTDVGVIDHVISTATNNDITPTSIGADLIQPAQVDPRNTNHIVAINRNDQDLLETSNGGTSWTTNNSALGITVDAMDIVFFGIYWAFGGIIAGNDGTDENVSYSPNGGTILREDTSAGLKAVGSITSVDIAPAAFV